MGDKSTLQVVVSNSALVPRKGREGDAGVDLFCEVFHAGATRVKVRDGKATFCCDDDPAMVLDPGSRVMIPTGVSLAIPSGYAGIIKSRSGKLSRDGLFCDGVIDSNYRGEIFIIASNIGTKSLTIRQYEKIAQMLIVPILEVKIDVVSHLKETNRGEKGFGSSGSF